MKKKEELSPSELKKIKQKNLELIKRIQKAGFKILRVTLHDVQRANLRKKEKGLIGVPGALAEVPYGLEKMLSNKPRRSAVRTMWRYAGFFPYQEQFLILEKIPKK